MIDDGLHPLSLLMTCGMGIRSILDLIQMCLLCSIVIHWRSMKRDNLVLACILPSSLLSHSSNAFSSHYHSITHYYPHLLQDGNITDCIR